MRTEFWQSVAVPWWYVGTVVAILLGASGDILAVRGNTVYGGMVVWLVVWWYGSVLNYVTLRYVTLCHALGTDLCLTMATVLCYVMMCCVVLCYVMLRQC